VEEQTVGKKADAKSVIGKALLVVALLVVALLICNAVGRYGKRKRRKLLFVYYLQRCLGQSPAVNSELRSMSTSTRIVVYQRV